MAWKMLVLYKQKGNLFPRQGSSAPFFRDRKAETAATPV